MSTKSTSTIPFAVGIGVRRFKDDKTLDVTYLWLHVVRSEDAITLFENTLSIKPNKNTFYELSDDQLKSIRDGFVIEHNKDTLNMLLYRKRDKNAYCDNDIILYTLFDEKSAVTTPEEAYLKLHLLSYRFVKPHSVNLDGAFKALHNVAWTNFGPMLPGDVPRERLKHIFTEHPLTVTHVDKFPYLINYHIPQGVRIASGSQVRLGAYLGEGTTVMPAGYVNFNAGTDGNTMVEGRVSAGVFVGDNSDVGGGASIMGTLSGGNKDVISIGDKCLLGANAGAGISLGFGCTIEAGLYVTAGSKVSLYNDKNKPVNSEGNEVDEGQNIVKAHDLSGRDHLLFLRDSKTGQIICKPNKKTISINKVLHQNA